jgi:hypothetical protein
VKFNFFVLIDAGAQVLSVYIAVLLHPIFAVRGLSPSPKPHLYWGHPSPIWLRYLERRVFDVCMEITYRGPLAYVHRRMSLD